MEPPLLLFACGHHDPSVCSRCIGRCLRSNSNHPRIRKLQRAPLPEQAQEVSEGAALEEFEQLAEFVSEVRWGFSAERRVEGGHATIHLKTSSARNRTESYDSLALRKPDVQAAIEEDMAALVDCVSRSPVAVVQELGLALQRIPQGRVRRDWASMAAAVAQ